MSIQPVMFLVELVALTVDSVAVAKYYAFAAESVPFFYYRFCTL